MFRDDFSSNRPKNMAPGVMEVGDFLYGRMDTDRVGTYLEQCELLNFRVIRELEAHNASAELVSEMKQHRPFLD